MKKSQKLFIIIGIIAVVALVPIVCFPVVSLQGKVTTSEPIQVLSVNLKTSVSSNMQNLNPMVVKNVLVINGKKNPLICTFQDQEKAMQSLKKRDAEFLKLMKKKWSLDDLSAANLKTYKKHLVQYTMGKLPDDLGGDKYEEQRQEVEEFLEFCENEERNQKTLKYINSANYLLKEKHFQRVSLDPIVNDLPFDDPLVQEASSSQSE